MPQQPANPLQLGQTLYEVLDLSVVATPSGATSAVYNRVIYNSDGAEAVDALTLGAQGEIIDVKAATNMHAGAQSVFVLTSGQIQMIGSANGAATSQAWPAADLTTIIDFDPQRIDTPALLVLGEDADGPFLQSLDCSSGELSSRLRLPTMHGPPTCAVLARRQLETHVIVCGVTSDDEVVINDLGSSVLGAQPAVGSIASVPIGPTQPSAVVSIATASLVAKTTDQQVVVAFPDQQGTLRLVVLGWTGDELAVLATAAPTLFAKPERASPVFRVAAGDLLPSSGTDIGSTDQIVVAYSATFPALQSDPDTPPVAGCAALALFELDASSADAKPGHELTLLSQYAAANDGQPIASIDLHVAVGLFGEALAADTTDGSPANGTAGVLGVVVVGGGASFAQVVHGEASITAGLVTVDPNTKQFPPLTDAPGTPQYLSTLMTIPYETQSFFALPSDVTGQSVVLGTPTLSQSLGKGQLLALVQAPPFEKNASNSPPMLTFGQSETLMTGYNVSSNKTWMFSDDTAATIGIAAQTLNANINSSYGYSFDNVDDNSTTTLVQTSSTITLDDLMVMYQMSYFVWLYPVFRKAKQSEPDGSLAVIFPSSPTPGQDIVPAYDSSIGYKPQSTSGVLLSYVGLTHDGLDDDGGNLLFGSHGIDVTDDAGGTTLTYDESDMVQNNVTKTFIVHNSVSDSAHFSFSKSLFDYVPVNFGLNVTAGETYSETDVQTTILSHTTAMTITLTSGSVGDSSLWYEISPIVYQHNTMGHLMVAYDVSMSGIGWKTYYPQQPSILLQPLLPNSHDPLLAAFSRSISFADNDDGTVEVSVEVFNNGLASAENVVCDFYTGAPTVAGGELTPPGNPVGTRTLQLLNGGARDTMSMPMELAADDEVVVSVAASGSSSTNVYWAIYPPSAYSTWSGPGAGSAGHST
jgi:hypothetical protein